MMFYSHYLRKLFLFFGFITIVFIVVSCEKNEVTELSFSNASLHINLGESAKLGVRISATGDLSEHPLRFESLESNVVAVDKDGVVTGLASGTSTIYVYAGGKEAKCTVTVVDEINTVLNQGSLYYLGHSLANLSYVKLVVLSGPVDTVYLYLNTELDTIPDLIPSGKYIIPDVVNSFDDFKPYTLLPDYSAYVGNFVREFYWGHATVSSSGGYYTISFVCTDILFMKIFGVFRGRLKYMGDYSDRAFNHVGRGFPTDLSCFSAKFRSRNLQRVTK